MIEVPNCVICGGPIRRLKRALVAPFLAKRIWDKAPFCVDLVRCDACGFMFYNPRLDDGDLQRLYENYRAEEYQRQRQASEPWYTPKFNEDLASASSYDVRRAKLAPILREHIGNRQIRRILDYGGDRGDLVAGLVPGAESYVYDISGIPAADGVKATSDPVGCKADLIINSNVLEHVGFPRQMVSEVFNASPSGGLVYLEVPSESPFGANRIARRIAQTGIVSLLRPALATSIARPASLYLMHEHINYFNEQSLTVLTRACGGVIIASGTYYYAGRAGSCDMAWCLTTRGNQ